MANSHDPYSVLGVSPTANAAEIRDAYRRLCALVHPDRFDPIAQRRQWEDAHALLKRINAAYSALYQKQGTASRERRRPSPQKSSPEWSTTKSEKGKSAAPPIAFRSGTAAFAGLPAELKARLLRRQMEKNPAIVSASVADASTYKIGASAAALWFVALFWLATASRWEGTGLLLLSATTAVAAFAAVRCIGKLISFGRGPLDEMLYVSPLYIYETRPGIVRWWPVGNLRDVTLKHKITDGEYEYSHLSFKCDRDQPTFFLRPRELAESVLRHYSVASEKLAKAVAEGDAEYVVRYDDFAAATASRRPAQRLTAAYIGLAGACFGLSYLSYAINCQQQIVQRYSSPRAFAGGAAFQVPVTSRSLPVQPRFDYQLRPAEQPPRQSQESSADDFFANLDRLVEENDVPVAARAMPLPESGVMRRFGNGIPIAPFEIKTATVPSVAVRTTREHLPSNHHYFIKLIDVATGASVLTAFVRSGDSVEVKVPLGSMYLRYAAGTAWYGEEMRFGPHTIYCQTEEVFDFTRHGTSIRGYTVELYLQADGNLREHRISPEEF